MTAAPTLAALDAFWAAELGCARADLHRPGTVVVARDGRSGQGYDGLRLFRRGQTCLVSAPPELATQTGQAFGGHPPADVFDPAALRAALGAAARAVVGPAAISVCDATDFRPVATGGVRRLDLRPGGRDGAALERLRAACPAEQWTASGLDAVAGPVVVFGHFAAGALTGAGKLQPVGEALYHVGILTDPAQRGRGVGRAVVSAMTAHGLRAGRAMLYQTLLANAPAVAVARGLGYRPYARTLAVPGRRYTAPAA
jgi:GNAT superfamily N-acetyltransferase